MTKIKLPRFPPRKAKKTPYLINFMVRVLEKFKPFPLHSTKRSVFKPKDFWKLLTLTSIQRTSISRKARDLREQTTTIPSGETVLRRISEISMETLNVTNQTAFLQFLDALPSSFQQVRKQGMEIVIDFHLIPNYTKHQSKFLCKGRHKASTNQFYQYLTVLWTNAPEPITLGIQLVSPGHSITAVTQRLLTPLLEQEKILCILADGEFYKWELINWLSQKQILFIIRGQLNSGTKPLLKKHQINRRPAHTGLILDYLMKKRSYNSPCPVKLVFWKEPDQIIVLVVPKSSNSSARRIRDRYKRRFYIETYYRQMHRFQAFSCSRHHPIRFILVLLAFWICNLWAYFKAPLQILKPSSRRCRSDKVYTANDFCEFLLSSWQTIQFKSQGSL